MHPDQRLGRVRAARLYLVSPARPGGRGLAGVLAAALRGGVDLFQLREKEADDDKVLAAAAVARELCGAAGVPFILNDRPDLVAAAGADGCHVGQDDLPVSRARELAGEGAIVGLSTHSPGQIAEAVRLCPDYVAVGPVHTTPTKPGRPSVGLELLHHARAYAPEPWFAIGGLAAGTLGAAVTAGARRAVVVRAITESDDPEGAARALRAALQAADHVHT